jgi:hypothetical protein
MKDLDTAMYLDDFKVKFYEPIVKRLDKYRSFESMPEAEQRKADEMEVKRAFLANFIACIEGTLEQNTVMRKKLE